jgi:CRP/FNR family transcriptional regulator
MIALKSVPYYGLTIPDLSPFPLTYVKREFFLKKMEKSKKIIAESVLFSGLSEEQLDKVSDIAVAKVFKRGASIFFEGDEADGFYMVVEGRVKIYKVSFEGKEQILHIFGPGEPFGEVPVFHGQPFPANALALVKSGLLFFPRREFVELVTGNPSLALNMLAMLSLRLRRFATQIENLSLKEVPGRLASHLLYLSDEQGSSTQVVLDIPKGQLASLLGTIPETLSRIFARMTDEGLIRVEGRTIYLDDLEGLREKE